MCAIPSIFRSSCSPGTASSRLTTLPLGDLQRKLAWDAASRLVQQDDAPTAGATESRRFGYDRLDRLLSQDVDASPSATNTQQFRYSWDLAGNRSTYSYKDGSGSWTYTHSTPSSSNRLASVTGSTGKLSYTYDEAGNPKGDGDKTYTWRASGWLESLSRNGLTTRYAYNGFAQRVAKLSGSTPNTSADTRLYTYDEAGHLLGEYTASGQLIQEHVWLGDTPIALIDAQGVKLVFADQLDTPRRITDTTGKALWKWNGEAFGLTLPNEDADGDGKALTYNLRFPGQVFDKESNLHYNWHRYYDPATGRYISSDPIGLAGGINTYGYVEGNPVDVADPYGLCPCGSPDAVIAAARADKRDWSKEADRTDINSGFPSGSYKCNLFADTQYEKVGYNLPNIGGSIVSRALGRTPPGAQSLSSSDYEVPGWPVVSGHPQPGDLIADKGHVGIYTGDGKTISASPSGVVENNWGSRKDQKPTIRRCTCPRG